MNKIYQVLGALILTTTAAVSNNYGGIFVGGGLGAAIMRAEGKYEDATSGNGKTTFNKFGAAYQIHAGYLTEIGSSKTMVGGDIYLNGSSAKKEGNVGVDGQIVAGSMNVKRSLGYGIALIIGKLVNPKVMIYGRAAYEMNRYNLDLNLGAQSQSVKKTYGGFVPGVGVDYKLTPNVIVGLGYDYAGLFGNKTVYEQGNVKIQVNPTEHRIMAKVAFVLNLFK